MNSVINSLKRLERVGSENSRCTEKLRKAVKEIAEIVSNQIEMPLYHEAAIMLPRNYVLTSIGTILSPHGCTDFQRDKKPGRNACLLFAQDVADGWLDELTDFIDARNRTEKKALDNLEVGLDRLQTEKL